MENTNDDNSISVVDSTLYSTKFNIKEGYTICDIEMVGCEDVDSAVGAVDRCEDSNDIYDERIDSPKEKNSVEDVLEDEKSDNGCKELGEGSQMDNFYMCANEAEDEKEPCFNELPTASSVPVACSGNMSAVMPKETIVDNSANNGEDVEPTHDIITGAETDGEPGVRLESGPGPSISETEVDESKEESTVDPLKSMCMRTAPEENGGNGRENSVKDDGLQIVEKKRTGAECNCDESSPPIPTADATEEHNVDEINIFDVEDVNGDEEIEDEKVDSVLPKLKKANKAESRLKEDVPSSSIFDVTVKDEQDDECNSADQEEDEDSKIPKIADEQREVRVEEEVSSISIVGVTAKDERSQPRYSLAGRANVGEEIVSKVLSLPIDSQHCIASFLTPSEFADFGQTCKGASRVCREIFRRVRMHGFRCATEVVAAWKLDQHADAKELAALYIHAGVPIYPHCLGHSYHTICWRMGVEAKEMQSNHEAEENNTPTAPAEEDSPVSRKHVDKFYSDRQNFRARDGISQGITYLEEKCLFWLEQESNTAERSGAGQNAPGRPFNRVSLFFNRYLLDTSQQQGPGRRPTEMLGAGIADPQALPSRLSATRANSGHGFDLNGPDSIGASLSPSKSQSDLQMNNYPKIPVRIHRHLLDQHVLGKTSVDDEEGAMTTSPVCLSADFFHPHQNARSPPMRSQSHAPTGSIIDMLTVNEVASAWDQSTVSEETDSTNGRAMQRNPLDAEFVGMDEFQVDLEPQIPLTPGGVPTPQQELSVDEGWTPSSPRQLLVSILNYVDMDVYSSTSANPNWNNEACSGTSELKRHLRTRFAAYQRRLEILLAHADSSGFDECLLDFWDEFMPLTSNIHYYDQQTAVPRVSNLHRFLTRPCPKAVGVVQCEIERIKINTRRKGVSMKGRLFPMYEYRLFIRDRSQSNNSYDNGSTTDSDGTRKDTVLMVAKNRGRKHVEMSGSMPVSSSSKKGANNYYLYMPQQVDIDTHFNHVNGTEKALKNNTNGASHVVNQKEDAAPMLLGRLQSNFIGTEFQIYTPRVRKRRPRVQSGAVCRDAEELDYDSGVSSDNTSSTLRRKNRFSRLSLRRNMSEHNSLVNENRSAFGGSSYRTIRRASSEGAVSRPTRMNRRAIANTVDSPDSQQQNRPLLCEEEDGVITYTANLLGSRPRIMDVCIPKVSPEGAAGTDWRKYLDGCDDADDYYVNNRMLNCFKQLQQRLENQEDDNNHEGQQTDRRGDFGLLALQNRPPWWNIELGSFVLNFRGRVSVASVKNFQLCDRNDHDHIMLQFGRIQGRHSFTMDFQYPLTAVQAFSIAISSLQSKISFG